MTTLTLAQPKNRSIKMRSQSAKHLVLLRLTFAVCLVSLVGVCAAQQTAAPTKVDVKATPSPSPNAVRTFDTPKAAADALVKAADTYDTATLASLFGPEGDDIVFTGEFVQDRQHAVNFAKEAHEQMKVTTDPKTGTRAFLLVGTEDWPFPVPIVKSGQKWHFDSKAGLKELLARRVGANELDAIQVCHGFVEAQEAYALEPRNGYDVNQYAQRIISTPGKQDGLAWQNSDGTWAGPIGEKIAKAIEQGYSLEGDPYHGYMFKILKGQGPDAPLGKIDYVVKGLMIGGFAIVAAPAEYGVTGVQTFIVSNDGVVFEKDLGHQTLQDFKSMELFNPDASWTPVPDEDETESP
jgi:Protein of unknown function (DUF2950)